MNTSAAIADPLLRRASGQRARPSDPHRTARVRIGSSGLRAPVSRRGSASSRRTVMNNAGAGIIHEYRLHSRPSRPAVLISFSLLDSLSGCLCRFHLREAQAGVGLSRLISAFKNNPRSLSGIAVRDEAKEVRPDARPQARKNRRRIRWNTLRILQGRARHRLSQIVRRSRKVNVGQAPS